MMDWQQGDDLQSLFDYAKAEVHDGDLFILRVGEDWPAKQARAFRRKVHEINLTLNWQERGIMLLVLPPNVEVVRPEAVKGPVRVEPQLDPQSLITAIMRRVQDRVGAAPAKLSVAQDIVASIIEELHEED